MQKEFHTQMVVESEPHYRWICNFNNAEDRLYLCQMMNHAAEEENLDLFFAPLGTAKKDGLVSELFFRTNRMPNQKDFETIFEWIIKP